MCPAAVTQSSSAYHSITIAESTDLVGLQQLNQQRYPFLLQTFSSELSPSDSEQSGFDILFAFPQQTLSLTNNKLKLGDNDAEKFRLNPEQGFLGNLQNWYQLNQSTYSQQTLPDHIPFAGGWFVYLGYELASEVEPKLNLPEDNSNFPGAFATRCPAAVIYDHVRKQTLIVTEPGQEHLVEAIQNDINNSRATTNEIKEAINTFSDSLVNQFQEEPSDRYLESVKKIKDYICDGDVFQVNLSRHWNATLKEGVDQFDLYRALSKTNPSPFAGLVCVPPDIETKFDNESIISSSPERLVSCNDNIVETRPIAGTRPRSSQSQQDQAYAEELMLHPKEIAEHIMLVDLERNDLGRVCVPGSIEVNDLMTRESYARVHHIVSNVTGRIRDDITPIDVLRAVFPGGTITGCPKVRCMEIIAELEQVARGPYTGSMGYINYNGKMDFNILIRTFMLQQDQLSLRTGAGIVYDSDPESELEETRSKAAALLDALGVNQD